MGVVDKLNALDDRAGASPAAAARMWPRWVRLWWLPLVGAYVVAIASILATAFGELAVTPVAVAVLPAVFMSGFLYNDRMRTLRTRPRLIGVPPAWPDETT